MSRHKKDIFNRGVRVDADLMLIPDYRHQTAECLADLRLLQSAVKVALTQLPQRYADVIRLLYGFDKNKLPLTHSEAARVLHCSQERVVCMRCMAIAKLAGRCSDLLRPFAPGRDMSLKSHNDL